MMKKIALLFFVSLAAGSLLFAQQPADSLADAELDGWLQQYATLVSDAHAKTDTSAVQDSLLRLKASQIVSEKQIAKTPKVKATKNKKKQKEELITADDSLELRRRAILEAVYNPMFLDWVFFTDGNQPINSNDPTDSVLNAVRAEARRYVFLNAPELFAYHSDDLPDIQDILGSKLNTASGDAIRLATKEVVLNQNEKLATVEAKKSNWTYGANFQLQVSQLYISSNWYNGGESNLYSLINIKANAKYDDKKRIQWENYAELKAGFISAGNDSLRMFRVNDDLLKLNTKLGVKAFGTFFYTAEAEMQTQFFNTFVPNTYERNTAAFSPIRFYLSLGMDYKYKDKLSVFVSPVSYKLVYVADTTVLKNTDPPVDPANNIAAKVGIESGKQSLNQVGGLLRINYKHKFTDMINMESKFSLYANYVGQKKGVEMDWEIIGNFLINRFLSAKVSLNPRYDNTIILPDGEKNKLQFKELISIGFNYKI